MAKKKKEEVVEETTPKQTVEETTEKQETVKIDLKKFKQKEITDNITKVDLSKPPKIEEDTVQGETTDNVQDSEEETKVEVSQQDTVQDKEQPTIEEVTEEVKEQVEETIIETEEAITESMKTGKELPENVQKLMKFMEETGGGLEDYVKLNQDYSNVEDKTLLREYYKQTKPHLVSDEIDFLIEDGFDWDEDIDDEKDIKRKKLAFKEQVANARQHLDGLKSNYYEEIKAGSKLTPDQQKAMNFFNRYNKEAEEQEKIAKVHKSTFTNKTNQVFNKNFKGFEYEVGDKKFRFNIKDGTEVKERQSDVNNFFKKFLKENGEMDDAKSYHKSLFTAMNSDAIANHFYEQGKADAMKTSIEKSKNIDMEPRQSHGEAQVEGVKYKVLGESSNDFKFKIKNKQ